MASAIGKDKEKRKRFLWWGAYLTMFQMFQFVTMMLQVCVAVSVITRSVKVVHHALSVLRPLPTWPNDAELVQGVLGGA